MRRCLPLLLAVAVAGCGAPKADEAAAAARAWVDDLAEERYGAACERMERGVAERLRNRYFKGESLKSCPEVLEAYRDAMSDSKLASLRSPGLEGQPPVKKKRVGVFPVAKAYELEVLLMRHSGDGWRVFSVGIPPA